MKNISKRVVAASLAAMLLASSVTSVSHAATQGQGGGKMGGQGTNEQSASAATFLKLLTDSEKESYKVLQEELQDELAELRGDEGDMEEMSDSEKEEMKAELEELVEEHQDEVKSLLSDNDEALEAYETFLEERGEMKGEISEKRTERNENIGENKSEMKEEGSEYKTERKENTSSLKDIITDAEAEELAELRAEYKEKINALKADMDEDMSDEEKQEIRDEYAALNKEYFENMQYVLAENDEALAVLEEMNGAKSEMKEKVKETKEKNSDERTAFREEKGELVDTYKKSFVTKLGNALDSIDDAKLEKVLVKIDAMEVTLEDNGTLTDSLAAKLQALKEIIEDRLEGTEEDIDLDDLFDF